MWIRDVAALEPGMSCQFGHLYLTHMGCWEWLQKLLGAAGKPAHGPGRQVTSPGAWAQGEWGEGRVRPGQVTVSRVRRAGRCPLPHGREWNWSPQDEMGEVSACWRAPPKRLLELGWEDRAVQGATQSHPQRSPTTWGLRHQAGASGSQTSDPVGFLGPRSTKHPGF